MRCSIAIALALCMLAPDARPVRAEAGGGGEAVASLDDLLARFARLPGMRARYREEKRIALLKRPLLSEGSIAFAAPDLLLRRVERPEPATMLLEGDVLHVADASGARRIDLRSSPIVRQLVLTFVHVLAGDRAALERQYSLRFARTSAGGGWRLELTPRQPDLARLVARAELQGEGVRVQRMTLDERNGDTTVMHFSDVDLDARYDAAARARVFRLPEH